MPGAVPGKAAKEEAWSMGQPCPDTSLMPPLLSPCSLKVQDCELRGSSLKPLPGQGLSLAISDSSIEVKGKWKARKSFL